MSAKKIIYYPTPLPQEQSLTDYSDNPLPCCLDCNHRAFGGNCSHPDISYVDLSTWKLRHHSGTRARSEPGLCGREARLFEKKEPTDDESTRD